MPNIQPYYNQYPGVAYEGLVMNQEPSNRISRTIESAAGIGFGKVAVQGADSYGIVVSQAGRLFRGITIADPTQQIKTQGVDAIYPQYATVDVLERGVIWVRTAITPVAGTAAYYIPATGLLTNVATDNIEIGIWDAARVPDPLSPGNYLAPLRIK